MPDVPADAALMKMEVAGICGTDVKIYKEPLMDARDHGPREHRRIAKAGGEFTRRKGFKEGDLVFVEHYVAAASANGAIRANTATARRPTGAPTRTRIRYGYTSADKPPHLWGGSRSTCTCRGIRCCTTCPKGVTPELAGLVTPMANGVEWSLFDGGVGYNSPC